MARRVDSAYRSRMNAVSTLKAEDDLFRVWEWRIPPGGSTEWHTHEYAYTVVPLVDGLMKIDTPDGWVEFPLTAGEPYCRPAGVSHDVHNGGDTDIVFIEVERKG